MDEIQERFLAFHVANPEVYQTIVTLAKQAKAAGHNKYGVKTIVEIMRWNHDISTTGSRFKLPNEYSSRYARLVMDFEPDLDGFFNTSKLGYERDSRQMELTYG